ncbi:MAG: hypothetical protein RJA70_415 [Pseudomonadota bacterium]|jgi:16S rRNA (adenine1518-N6/adenine1519-N6)-dimethyltransferase
MPQFPLPKQTLDRHGLRPKRSFGQNFLCDQSLVEKIAACCGSLPGTVVEIGAGLGGLTYCLLERGHHVIAIERDRDMIAILGELNAYNTEGERFRLLEDDAKSVDYRQLFASAGAPRVLCGNLPYNLTGVLMRRAIELAPYLERVVFLVQLEVADRLAAQPSSAAYGALSVFAQAAFKAERAFIVRRGAFYPQPGVDSAVVTLTPREDRVPETPRFQKVVSSAFAARRKTLRNAWRALGLSSEQLQSFADNAQISLDARGETLGVDDFRRMSDQFGD